MPDDEEEEECMFERDQEDLNYLDKGRNLPSSYKEYEKMRCLLCNYDTGITDGDNVKVLNYPWISQKQMSKITTFINNGVSKSDIDKSCIKAAEYYNKLIISYNKNVRGNQIPFPELTAKQIKDHFMIHSPTPQISLFGLLQNTYTITKDAYKKINKINKKGKTQHSAKYTKEFKEFTELYVTLHKELKSSCKN